MMKQLLRKIFGTRNDRLLKEYKKIVEQINQLEPEMVKLTDVELQAKTMSFKEKLQQGATLNNILPEVFAVCREASKRVLNMRHFDAQLIGGIVLHNCKIAEMRTGEGKTLVATLVVYLNALTGKGVHVVTVNDYLAKRDATEMGRLYNFLGLSVGVNLPDIPHEEKRLAYASDVTYGTNNEFGFDYLRDNMVFEAKDKVQRELNFAVVDEVDSILIDEARTPLIISGQAEGSDELYHKLNQVPHQLIKQDLEDSIEGDFWVDEKNHNVILSEAGHEKVEYLLTEIGLLPVGDSLYNVHNIGLVHHLLAALKAHYVYLKDQHYVVQNNEVVIVDEFTGRLMSGRRWSDGLHQAVEAKEGVAIQRENQTMAAITFQNYFRMYKHLSGMTGTADTEAYEFQQIYGLETVVIPTNKPMIRMDYNDKIYMNMQDKYQAIINDIQECNLKGQPVLVGTTSVENSETLAKLLTMAKLKHEVLNAKQHAREAEIIAQAGSPFAITVATNMAGRGTDIILGGSPKLPIDTIKNNPKLTAAEKEQQIKRVMSEWSIKNQQVLTAGGLVIIGTERHESRRIDNQLRGRSGRQGDPGASRFYLSLDDPLLRIFGGERMRSMMQRLGMKAGESIEHKWLSRSIESAQRKVEGHNFDIRKQLLDYDNVANDQRRVIYEQRDYILTEEDLSDTTNKIISGVINDLFDLYIPAKSMQEQWNVQELDKILQDEFLINYSVADKLTQNSNIHEEDLKNEILNLTKTQYLAKMSEFSNKVNADVKLFVDSVLAGDEVAAWNTAMLEDFCLQNDITLPNGGFTNYLVEHPNITRDNFKLYILNIINDMGRRQIVKFERGILLQHIDHYWREHLTLLEQLREGIHLRGYAQKDPKREYQNEAFNLFSSMLDNIKRDAAKMLLVVKIQGLDDIPTDDWIDNTQHPKFIHKSAPSSFVVQNSGGTEVDARVGRNALCPCGSGKKYKHCHGKLT